MKSRLFPLAAALAAVIVFLAARTNSASDLQRVGFLIPPTIPEIVYFYELAPNASGRVTGVWIATDVGEIAPANFLIDSLSLELPPGGEASFTLTRPTNGWPLGLYRLELYLNGRLVAVEPFVIQQD